MVKKKRYISSVFRKECGSQFNDFHMYASFIVRPILVPRLLGEGRKEPGILCLRMRLITPTFQGSGYFPYTSVYCDVTDGHVMSPIVHYMPRPDDKKIKEPPQHLVPRAFAVCSMEF